MRRKLPPLNAIKVFEAVERHGSFSRAASEFNVTTGAVSRQIKSLERFLGTKLYSVSGRGFEPTLAAQKFAAEVRVALEQIADSAARLIEPASACVIKLDSSPAFALHWLIPHLKRFECSDTKAQVKLSTTSRSAEDFTRHFDIVIRRYPMTLPGYSCRKLVSDFGVPVAAPELLSSQPVLAPSDLRGHSLLSCEGHDGQWEKWMTAASIHYDSRPVFYDQFHTLMQVLVQGFGVALGPVTLVGESLRTGQLVAPLTEPRVTFPPYYMLYREDRAASGSVLELANWLLSEAAIFEKNISGILKTSAKLKMSGKARASLEHS